MISPELHQRAKIEAATRGITIRELIEKALDKYLVRTK